MQKIVLLLFVYALIGITLAGCSDVNKIKFYRQSAVQDVVSQITSKNDRSLSKSSGVYIYKTKIQSEENNHDSMNFGPKDINFDMPLNLK